jgi:Na+/H+ antiporter NhaD/arsenite permease-like protein
VDPTKYLLGYLLVVLLAVSEAFPMSLSAMVGAALLVAFGVSDGIFSFSEALSFIDLELLALLVGVMIVVEVVDRCGTFRYLALKVVRRVLKRPVLLLVVAGLMSALTSLLLSDEAALLLIVAILLSLGKAGALDPVPFAVSSAIMVNLGGTGTLVGSVPNMAIGIRAGFSFAEFASYLLPCEFALYGVTLALLYLYYRGKLQSSGGEAELEEIEVSRVDVAKGAFLLSLMLALLIAAGIADFPASAAALASAVVALALAGFDTLEVFQRLDWDTVFFTAAFTVIIGVLERVEALKGLALWLQEAAGGSLALATLLVLLVSGAASLLLPNLIVALSLIPVVEALPFADKRALWSALVLGANLGGVGLPVSSFVIVMTIGALRREGYEIDPWAVTRVGIPVTAAWLGFSAIYLLTRFGLI